MSAKSGGSEPAGSPTAAAAPCRLPIGATANGLGGFFSYPAGSFVPDAGSQLTYNASHGRWLANPRPVVSPDGTSLLRADHPKLGETTSLVAVDLASSGEHTMAVVPGEASPQAWELSGIYYLHTAPGGDQELAVVNTKTGTSTVVAGQSNATGLPLFKAWTTANGGAVWSKTVENSGSGGDVLVRVDLASGAAQVWFQDPTVSTVDVLGFTADGDPVAAISRGNTRSLVVLTGPGASTPIQAGTFRPADMSMGALGVSDPHGLWLLASDGGIWLLRDALLSRVGAAPLPPAVSPTSDMGALAPALVVAGQCS